MKSQVNGLLHVLEGVLKDASLTYPALRDEFAKDFGRLALIAQTRGLTLFTLDLPSLEAILLDGLENGRLRLGGPLSTRKSPKIQVPRLFSGLWLRVFDKDACLKQDVDVNSLFFLRQLLVLGKKIEVVCSDDRVTASIGAYDDIERKLRRPSLDWAGDSLTTLRADQSTGLPGSTDSPAGEFLRMAFGNGDDQHRNNCGVACHGLSLLPYALSEERSWGLRFDPPSCEGLNHELKSLHLREALSSLSPRADIKLPLFFSQEGYKQDVPETRAEDSVLLDKIQRIADLVIGAMHALDPVAYSAQLERDGHGIGFRHGPGAVSERLGGHEKSCFPNWSDKLQNVFPYESCGRTVGSPVGRPPRHEVPSRLLCVPKTAKAPRLIAAEPTSHQWCQQLVLRFLFEECRRLFGGDFIDFKDQTKSGDMVLEASRDGHLTTVDLSEASDRLSCWVVERMFRSNPSLLLNLHAARTRYIRVERPGYENFILLKKFASQGTAVTFPVMSLVMLFIALGVSLEGDVTWQNIRALRRQVRIFGDDIIIPKSGYARLLRVMDILELKVNSAKSYVHGKFRESCGVDGYDGYDVTPSKPKTLVADGPSAYQAILDQSNNLFNKGLWYGSESCLHLLPARLRRTIRIVERNADGFAGLSSHTGGDERHLKRRWNSRLHRYEVAVFATYAKAAKRPREGFSTFLDFVSRSHSPEQARVVSEYVENRKVRNNLLWEPANDSALSSDQGASLISPSWGLSYNEGLR